MNRKLFKILFVLVLLALSMPVLAQEEIVRPVMVTYEGDCDWVVTFVVEGLRPNRDVVIDAIADENPCGEYPTSTGWEGWEVGRRTNSQGVLHLSVLHHAWGEYEYVFYTGNRSVTIEFSYGSPESYIDSPVPPVTTNEVCSNALEPTLGDGDLGRVTFTDGTPTALREEPQGDVITRLAEGTRFRVISDPVCTTARNGHLWWVQVRARGQVGWVPFGYEGSEYWIEPVPAR